MHVEGIIHSRERSNANVRREREESDIVLCMMEEAFINQDTNDMTSPSKGIRLQP